MPNIIRGTAGEHVPIRLLVRERRSDSEDGRTFAPNGVRFKRVIDQDENDVTNNASFTEVTDGEFLAYWDARDRDAGYYEAEIEIAHGWDTVQDTRQIHRHDVVILLEEAT